MPNPFLPGLNSLELDIQPCSGSAECFSLHLPVLDTASLGVVQPGWSSRCPGHVAVTDPSQCDLPLRNELQMLSQTPSAAKGEQLLLMAKNHSLASDKCKQKPYIFVLKRQERGNTVGKITETPSSLAGSRQQTSPARWLREGVCENWPLSAPLAALWQVQSSFSSDEPIFEGFIKSGNFLLYH